MRVNGEDYRTIWMQDSTVYLIDQNKLPFHFEIFESSKYFDTCFAITTMLVRGAGAIGAAAGFAMAQAFLEAPDEGMWDFIDHAREDIEATRPTARNLFYAVEKVYEAGKVSIENACDVAQRVADEDARDSRLIGNFGNELIHDECRIATHCNAGWLAFVDYGTALSPIYTAHRSGKKVFVYADETRPRGQGARLTAWELHNEHIPHVIIPDNATASLMQNGDIDLMIVGADRIAANGDVANKIGTLEKAITARYYKIPFFVAAPTSTIDRYTERGSDIPIEKRSEDEVLYQNGLDRSGNIGEILVCSPGSRAYNPAFDITPAKLISGIITEKGIIQANKYAIRDLFEKE